MSKLSVNTIAHTGGATAMTIDSNGIVSNSNLVYGIAKYTLGGDKTCVCR